MGQITATEAAIFCDPVFLLLINLHLGAIRQRLNQIQSQIRTVDTLIAAHRNILKLYKYPQPDQFKRHRRRQLTRIGIA